MAKARQKAGGARAERGPRVKVGVTGEKVGRSKGRGGTVLVPTLTIEDDRRRRRTGRSKASKGRAVAEHLFDVRLEELTAAAKRIDPESDISAVDAGSGVLFLSRHGAVGLAPIEASESIRAHLRRAPGARLECRVLSASEGAMNVSVSVVRAVEGDPSAAPVEAVRSAAEPVAAVASDHGSR